MLMGKGKRTNHESFPAFAMHAMLFAALVILFFIALMLELSDVLFEANQRILLVHIYTTSISPLQLSIPPHHRNECA